MISNSAFRTLVIDTAGKLSLKDGMIVFESDDGTFEYAISQFTSIMLNTQNVLTTTALLAELQKNLVSVVVCNERKLPVGIMCPLGANMFSSGRIMEQAVWDSRQKKLVWAEIVRQKIINSSCFLQELGNIELSNKLLFYANGVKPGDATNREAISARRYFRALFGGGFTRQVNCTVNSALNYGYAIIASKISRFLTSAGYSTALGIHHCSYNNFWNLTYDFIEPFRVFVDRCVYEHKHCEFDKNFKKLLIEVCENRVLYSGKNYLLSDAIELFCRDALSAVSTVGNDNIKLGEIKIL